MSLFVHNRKYRQVRAPGLKTDARSGKVPVQSMSDTLFSTLA